MVNNIFPKLAVATATAALSLTAINVSSAQAATITYDLNVNITSGSLTGTKGSGFLSFDPSLPPPLEPSLSPLTDFFLSFLGNTYTENSIALFNRLTQVSFFEPNGEQLGNLRFVVPADCGIICQPELVIDNNSFLFFEDPIAGQPSFGNITYSRRSTSIPEPSAIWGLVVLGIGLFVKKKVASS